MTIDTRTEAERRYDAERDGSAYVKPEPAEDIDLIIAILEIVCGPEDEDEDEPRQIGTIDGEIVTARYMDNGVLWEARVAWNGMRLATDGRTYVSVPDRFDPEPATAACGDFSLSAWGRVKELATTDVVERLIGLARQHATA